MSNAFSQYFSKIIQAGSQLDMNITGSVFKCRKCSAAAPLVTVSFDDGQDNPISKGDVFDLKNAPGKNSFSKLTFKNSDTADATITFFVGSFTVTFGQDNAAPSTYPKGNFGFASQNDVNAFVNISLLSAKTVSGGGGKNYIVGDILTLAGGTGTAATLIVTSVHRANGNDGIIGSVSVVNTGSYTAAPSDPNSATGGSGTGAKLNLTLTSAVTGISYNATYGALDVASNSNFVTPNVDGGHDRAQIILRVISGSALRILDAAGRLVLRITSSDPPAALGGGKYQLVGDGGTSTISSGEDYYSDL